MHSFFFKKEDFLKYSFKKTVYRYIMVKALKNRGHGIYKPKSHVSSFSVPQTLADFDLLKVHFKNF